jgi:VWFA-related protein
MRRSLPLFFRAASVVLSPALLVPICGSASPQGQSASKASSGTSQQQTTIRATTRLVQVDVIVQNNNGAPLTGLKKENFTLLDGGTPQEIAFFSSTSIPGALLYPLPDNFFTNRSDLKGQDPGRVIVILFDSLNTSFEDQAYARQHVLRFLQSVKPQDHVAIFALTTDLLALHDFTEDAAALASSVNRFSPRLLAAFDASHPELFHAPALANDPFWSRFENRVNNANSEIADARTGDRFRITYAALMAIAEYVSGIPGHKSLVWVSGGIPIQLGDDRIGIPDRDNFNFGKADAPGMANAQGVTGLARILNRVNMAIYCIDAHGIDADDSASGFFMRQSQRDTFQTLADDTGGKAFYGTNDIAGAISAAFEDGRYMYTLGFYPSHGAWDGKFREIKIKLPFRGARLRYRRGYFAFPERFESEAIMKTDLQEAARSPLDATGLGVTVVGKHVASSSARLLQLQVKLDPKQFLLHDQDSHSKGGLDLLFLQRNSEGGFLAAEKQHFDVNFSRKEYDFLAKAGLVLQRRVDVDPASSEIRVLVRDAGSGALGSVTIPMKKFF